MTVAVHQPVHEPTTGTCVTCTETWPCDDERARREAESAPSFTPEMRSRLLVLLNPTRTT